MPSRVHRGEVQRREAQRREAQRREAERREAEQREADALAIRLQQEAFVRRYEVEWDDDLAPWFSMD